MLFLRADAECPSNEQGTAARARASFTMTYLRWGRTNEQQQPGPSERADER